MKLTIELVPATSWYENLRSLLSKSQWDKVRKKCYAEAGHVCEICGGTGKKHPVECHEVWSYDDVRHTQTLIGLQALCPACHAVKHAGRSIQTIAGATRVLKQLMKVNNISEELAGHHVFSSLDKWEQRSRHEWFVNTDYLKTYLAS